MKYSAHAECEILLLRSQCEMKFAHIRISEYFTFAKQIFHSVAISHGEAIFHSPKANFVEKSTHCLGRQMCAFFWRRRWDLNPRDGITGLRDFESRLFNHLSTSPYYAHSPKQYNTNKLHLQEFFVDNLINLC